MPKHVEISSDPRHTPELQLTRHMWMQARTHKLPYPDSVVTKRPPTTVSVSAPFFIGSSLMPALADSSSDTGSHLRTQRRWHFPDCDPTFMSSQSQQWVSAAPQWCRQPRCLQCHQHYIWRFIPYRLWHVYKGNFVFHHKPPISKDFDIVNHRLNRDWMAGVCSFRLWKPKFLFFFFSLSLYNISKRTISVQTINNWSLETILISQVHIVFLVTIDLASSM